MVFSAEFQPKVGQEFWDRVHCEALKRLGTQSKLWTISIGQLITRETLQSQLHRWRHQIQATSWGGDKARTYYTGNCLVVNPKVTVNAKIIILFFSLLSLAATLSQLLAWETRSVLITTSYLIETYLQISLLEFFSPPSSQGLLPLIPSLPPEPSSWSHSSVFWRLASDFARRRSRLRRSRYYSCHPEWCSRRHGYQWYAPYRPPDETRPPWTRSWSSSWSTAAPPRWASWPWWCTRS